MKFSIVKSLLILSFLGAAVSADAAGAGVAGAGADAVQVLGDEEEYFDAIQPPQVVGPLRAFCGAVVDFLWGTSFPKEVSAKVTENGVERTVKLLLNSQKNEKGVPTYKSNGGDYEFSAHVLGGENGIPTVTLEGEAVRPVARLDQPHWQIGLATGAAALVYFAYRGGKAFYGRRHTHAQQNKMSDFIEALRQEGRSQADDAERLTEYEDIIVQEHLPSPVVSPAARGDQPDEKEKAGDVEAEAVEAPAEKEAPAEPETPASEGAKEAQ